MKDWARREWPSQLNGHGSSGMAGADGARFSSFPNGDSLRHTPPPFTMGTNASSEMLRAPLTAMVPPVASMRTSLCAHRPVTLHLKENMYDDFCIREVTTNQVVFRVEGAVMSLSGRKTLLDPANQPVLLMKRQFLAMSPRYNFYADGDESKQLCTARCKITAFESKMSTSFVNTVTGERCVIGLEGDWRSRHAVIWMRRSELEERVVVAKVYRPTTASRSVFVNLQDYYITIAPGVDTALIRVPVVLTRDEFCFQQHVTLHMKKGMMDDYIIFNAQTKQEVFQIHGKVLSTSGRKTLRDPADQPVLLMKRQRFRFHPHYDLFEEGDEDRRLCTARGELSPFASSMSMPFTDAVTGEQCVVGLDGDMFSQQAVIWMQRKDHGSRMTVAKVYRPITTGRGLLLGLQDYYIDIAPGVDAALIIMLCVMLDVDSMSRGPVAPSTLAVLSKPVALASSALCSQQPVTLHLKEKMFDDFSIRDANTQQVMFRIQGSIVSLSGRKILLNTRNQPILLMKRQLLSFSPRYDLFANGDESRLHATAKCKITMFESRMSMPFTNVVTREPCVVGLDGDWLSRTAVIWLQRGNSSVRMPVAKIYRPTSTVRNMFLDLQDYYIDIAPGVDAAVIVMLCVMLDEDKND
ncbi:TPA: hypothetical protein N0F65_002714 [Lagenidium giganteum]|uniref:Uncharacterized protein n=1 Tax=Lagenidium giganteum TaxID=4803 RepID=A0AAV2Z242_9STRA|nr:TPA: hypothetical protein N0F65_002714 [Lagenidium giganteum]